jgi:hypothetical protein
VTQELLFKRGRRFRYSKLEDIIDGVYVMLNIKQSKYGDYLVLEYYLTKGDRRHIIKTSVDKFQENFTTISSSLDCVEIGFKLYS